MTSSIFTLIASRPILTRHPLLTPAQAMAKKHISSLISKLREHGPARPSILRTPV